MLIRCGTLLKVFGGSYLAMAVWLVSRGEAARSFLLADFEGEMLGFLGGIKSFFSEQKMWVFNHEKSNQSLQGPGFDIFHLTSCFPRLKRYCGELSTAAVLATPVPCKGGNWACPQNHGSRI